MAGAGPLIYETTSTTGTGNVTVGSVTGWRRLSDEYSLGSTDLFYYFIRHTTAAEYEIGTGHLSATSTLVRDTVLKSSNADSLVNFTAGTKTVTNDIPALRQNSVTASDTAPTNPDANDVWYESSTGSWFVYYDDGTSSQWVENKW